MSNCFRSRDCWCVQSLSHQAVTARTKSTKTSQPVQHRLMPAVVLQSRQWVFLPTRLQRSTKQISVLSDSPYAAMRRRYASQMVALVGHVRCRYLAVMKDVASPCNPCTGSGAFYTFHRRAPHSGAALQLGAFAWGTTCAESAQLTLLLRTNTYMLIAVHAHHFLRFDIPQLNERRPPWGM